MKSKKLATIIAIILFTSCRTTKDVIPAPKYTPSYTYHGLEVEKYQSSIDTSMNYLEDLFEVFPEHNK